MSWALSPVPGLDATARHRAASHSPGATSIGYCPTRSMQATSATRRRSPKANIRPSSAENSGMPSSSRSSTGAKCPNRNRWNSGSCHKCSGDDNPQHVPPKSLLSNRGRRAFRYDFAVPLRTTISQLTDSVDGNRFTISVPGNQSPRMAYASCNGFSSPKDMKHVADKNGLVEGNAGKT